MSPANCTSTGAFELAGKLVHPRRGGIDDVHVSGRVDRQAIEFAVTDDRQPGGVEWRGGAGAGAAAVGRGVVLEPACWFWGRLPMVATMVAVMAMAATTATAATMSGVRRRDLRRKGGGTGAGGRAP